MIITHKSGFYFILYDFIVLLECLVLYCRFVMTFCFSWSYSSILFVYMRFKQLKHI